MKRVSVNIKSQQKKTIKKWKKTYKNIAKKLKNQLINIKKNAEKIINMD